MYFSNSTVDDLLHRVLTKLLNCKWKIRPSRGDASEMTGVLLQLTNPRARLSRTEKKGKVFSCVGELIWYLAKTNELNFIAYYVSRYRDESDDGATIYGAYGPRLFRLPKQHGLIDQVQSVLSLLAKNPESRRAVIQLFDAVDIVDDANPKLRHTEVPCTCTLQFMVRRGRLHMLTSMRSNDAFLGLPHDIFAFTMLQEIVARALGAELGSYKHFVGSLHLYDRHVDEARAYLREGFQEKIYMPAMPYGNPWNAIAKLVNAEKDIRTRGATDIGRLKLDPYWADLIRLLQVYRFFRNHNSKAIADVKNSMSVRNYDAYIEKKRKAAEHPAVKRPRKSGGTFLEHS